MSFALPKLRLIRTGSVLGYSDSQILVSRAASSANSDDLWLVSHLYVSAPFEGGYESTPRVRWQVTRRGTEKIKNCVVNIQRDVEHDRFEGTNLSIEAEAGKTTYIVFSHHPAGHRFSWNSVRRNAMRPVKVQLLNSLLDSIVVPGLAKVVLVGIEEYSHTWLGDSYLKAGDTRIEPPTPGGASLRTRIEAWISLFKSERGGNTGQVFTDISFMSLTEFEAVVPMQEMFELIMSQ
jgi:hypothetical protein